MAAIDSLLKLVIQSNANELRVGSGKAPRMFQSGTPKPLTMREMSADELRYVLGAGVLTEERSMLVRRDGQVEFSYLSPEAGVFHVVLTRRALPVGDAPIDIDLVFVHGPRVGAQAGAAPPGASGGPGGPGGPGASASSTAPVPASPASGPTAPGPAPILFPTGTGSPSRPSSPGAEPPSPALELQAGPSGPAWSAHEPGVSDGSGVIPQQRQGSSSAERLASTVLEQDPPIAPSAELSSLIAQAAALRASDLHLCSGERPFARVDGRLAPLDESPFPSLDALLAGCLGPVARRQIAAGRSVDLSGTTPGVGRFRLNVYRASAGLAAAVRLLPAQAPSLAELSLPFPLDDLVELPHGLVVVCGPTGSGKSSTLAALAQEALKRRSIMLLSLEDPIEYQLSARGRGSLIRQRQVGRDVADFPTGLRDALREDPDVMLIGEMRDPETIGLALTAAETGHLVLTSLHSRSAPSAVERIVDSYPPERQQQIRVQLADALRAVVAQRLIPRARGGGRLPALEVMRINHSVASLIREGKTAQMSTAIQSGRREGMIPLERCLADMVRSGQIADAAARSVANDPSALSSYAQG